MKKIKIFLVLVIISSLSFLKTYGTSSILKENFPLTIKNPSLSHEQRLKLKLPNHLEVLLISDYKTTLSGAALVVNSGSWDNPKDHLGLAHLTEHCVFLGSQKYPGVADFSNHLTKHNGTYNAFTSDKTTTYLFAVNNEGFLEALDQMSSFLKDPLFREDDINKEKTAVHEEFSRNKFNDQWRMFRLEQLISNPNHPSHLFSTGNLVSLEHSSSQDMKKWFQQHYFAKNMKLIVFSSLPLNVLVEKVEEYFSTIPEEPSFPSSQPSLSLEPFFDATSKNKIFITQPLINKSIINLIWILPEEYSTNLSAIQQIAFLLQHGNKNGLIDNLKKELLISNLTTDIYSHKKNVEFNIEIELTEKGDKEYLRVLDQCFTYLNYLQNENIPQYIFDEINITNTLEYEFQDHQDLFSYLNQLSKQLSEESVSDYPSRQYLLKNNDLKTNEKLLHYLANPEHCRFLFLTNSFTNSTKDTTYYDPIYELNAIEIPLTINGNLKTNIELPKKNPFLTTLNVTPLADSLEKKKTTYPFQPKQFNQTGFSSLYYAVNDYMPGPKAFGDLLISFPKKFPFNKNFVLTDLFVTLTKDASRDLTSYAKTASLDSSLTPSINGIKVTISGFSNNAGEFLNSLVSTLTTYKFSKEEFKNAVHKLSEDYTTNKYRNPILQGIDLLFNHLVNGYVSLDQKITTISELSWQDFQLFSNQVFQKVFIEGMFLGNLSKKELSSITNTISTFSRKKEKYNVSNNQYLHIKKHLKEETITESCPFDSNVLIFSLAKDNVSSTEFVSSSLLFKALHTAFFEELRTKQQVGYAVGTKLKPISLQALCGIFYIQSQQYTPEELLEKTKTFLQDFKNNPSLYGLSQNSFLLLKNSFIDELTHPDESLEEICSYLFDLTFNPYNSQSKNSINKIIEAAKKLRYEEFLELMNKFLNFQNVIVSKVFINATSK